METTRDYEQELGGYREMVYAFLLRMSRSHELADELTQETFYQAIRHWKDYRGDSSVSSWLCAIAKRQYYSVLRKVQPLPMDEVPEQTVPDFAEALADSDRAMAAQRALHCLPEPYREVFTLRTFADLNHTQIAALFGKSDSWARVTYYRARQMLAEAMKEDEADG